LAVLFLAALLPSGCSSDQAVLYVYNWGTYIDESVNDLFEEEYNCKVVYENYASNEEMYLKLKNGTSTYDVVFPSDYMIEKMIDEDMLLPLDYDNIPEFSNIDSSLLDLSFDPGNVYSVPYFWGTVGILYNTEMVDEDVTSWDVLWDEDYAGEILMYDSQRDSLAVALKLLGYSMNTRDQSELDAATQKLIEQKPLVLAYVTDTVIDMMIGEEAALAVVYSGDAVYCMSENENLAYVVPDEGSNIWYDNMAIPTTSQNKELAEAYINFMCRDDIALLNTEEVGYTSSNANVLETMKSEDWANNDAYFTPQDVVARCEIFEDPGDFIDAYADAWEKVKISD
jgi:spermidine/putrescine transport system substrate-binding protein